MKRPTEKPGAGTIHSSSLLTLWPGPTGRPFWDALDGEVGRLLREPGEKEGWRSALAAINGLAFGRLGRFYRASLAAEGKRRSEVRLRAGRPRSVWGVTPVVSIIPCAAADRLLLSEADSLVFQTYYITDDFDVRVDRVKDWVEHEHPELLGALHHLIFAWALLRYDIFHYFNDRGILPPTGDFGVSSDELELLRAAGKWLFTYGYGADFRSLETTKRLGEFNNCMDCPEPGKYCVCSEETRLAVIGRVSPYAHGMHSMADGHHYIPNSFRSYYWPIDLTRILPAASSVGDAPGAEFTIAHSPNHGEFKGTKLLVEAVDRLRSLGAPIRLDLVSGVSNRQVLERFRRADVVADQFINGYHGYTALEAMALGKPVLCYLRDPNDVLAPESCPIINTHPRAIESVLSGLMARRGQLQDIGKRSRNYVEDHYSIQAFSGRLAAVYKTVGLLDVGSGDKIWRSAEHYVAGVGRPSPVRRPPSRAISATVSRALFPLAVTVDRTRRATLVAADVSPLRILHGPVNLGNQAGTLAAAERRLGADSRLMTCYPTWLQYPSDRCLLPAARPSLLDRFSAFAAVGATPFKYDVLHCYFSRSWVSELSRLGNHRIAYADLYAAKSLGRRIVFTLQGCDVRLAGRSGKENAVTPCALNACAQYENCVASTDASRQWFIDQILPLADEVFYLNPELGRYLPRGEFLPYGNVDIQRISSSPPRPGRAVPRILHAPSDPKIKGTERILEALQRLRLDYQFELVVVENETHERAMQMYRDADLIIDQVLAGWYGGFAVEAMAMGKPVACYVRDGDLGFGPDALRLELPVIRLAPDAIAEGIAAFLDARDTWLDIGERSRRFVERWHDPDATAEWMRRRYRAPGRGQHA